MSTVIYATMLLNLNHLLFNHDVQKHFLVSMLEELENYKIRIKNECPYSSNLLYGAEREKKLSVDRNFYVENTSIDLSTILGNLVETPNYIGEEFVFGTIRAKLQWAIHENVSPLILTWFVLVFLYVSPELRRRVQLQTEPALSYFFKDFEHRFEINCWGVLTHIKDKKEERSKLDVSALSPLQIVVKECSYFLHIQSTNPDLLLQGQT